MDISSHFMVGHVIGRPAQGKTVLELFPMPEMFWSSLGRL